MPIVLTLPDGYGYVALIALGVVPFIGLVHGTVTGLKRRAAQVPYPNAYATAEQVKTNKAAYTFNCAQRAHAQFLENMPQTMASMLFAGAFYPQWTLYLSAAWAVFRIFYGYGYIYSTKPLGAGRYYGVAYQAAQLGLWGMCINAAWKMI